MDELFGAGAATGRNRAILRRGAAGPLQRAGELLAGGTAARADPTLWRHESPDPRRRPRRTHAPAVRHLPKPLLEVRGKRLIEWHLEALARAGVREVVVNTAWLEEQFPAALGDGSRYGVRIDYSFEGRDHGGALETAGGIAKALPLLGDVFWVVSGDMFVPDFPFDPAEAAAFAAGDALGELWFVPNPPFHPGGDFGIDAQGRARRDVAPKLTYANLALFRAALFADVAPGTQLPLAAEVRRGDRSRRAARAHVGRHVGEPRHAGAAGRTAARLNGCLTARRERRPTSMPATGRAAAR